jgi:hypothetical protein
MSGDNLPHRAADERRSPHSLRGNAPTVAPERLARARPSREVIRETAWTALTGCGTRRERPSRVGSAPLDSRLWAISTPAPTQIHAAPDPSENGDHSARSFDGKRSTLLAADIGE